MKVSKLFWWFGQKKFMQTAGQERSRIITITKNFSFFLRIVFDNCTDLSYELFTNWLVGARDLFESIILLNTLNDQSAREKHVGITKNFSIGKILNI
jgi:hypothetical protein